MAKAKLVALAEEITDDLNKQKLSLSFEATRTYKPKPKLENTDQLTVLVAMTGSRFSFDNRGEGLYEHDIDIAAMFRGNENAGVPTEKFDQCMRLLEEIADYYRATRPTVSNMPLANVQFIGSGGAIYIAEHINEFNQFTGIVRLTFQEWRT